MKHIPVVGLSGDRVVKQTEMLQLRKCAERIKILHEDKAVTSLSAFWFYASVCA